MARYSAGVKAAGAGSTTLPLASIYAAASVAGRLIEVGVTNTTTTAFDVKLVRLTTTGTQGSAAGSIGKHDSDAVAASLGVFNTHTANPTLGNDLGYRASIGAAIGAGVIWTMGDGGIRIPTGTGNGIGVIVENGTGQVAQIYFVWTE